MCVNYKHVQEEELFDWYFQESNKLKAAGDSAGFSAIVKILQINRVSCKYEICL